MHARATADHTASAAREGAPQPARPRDGLAAGRQTLRDEVRAGAQPVPARAYGREGWCP